MKIYYILICFLCLITGCHKDSNSVNPAEISTFSIYLLKNHDLRITDILDKDINSLELESEPWLAPRDVAFYDYSAHCIYLTKNKDKLFTDEANIKMYSQPFVVHANGKRCYVGIFHSMVLSSAPVKPYISEFDIDNYPKDVLHISQAWNGIDQNDLRINGDVEKDLQMSNKLHKGLSLSISNVNVISNQDTGTVRYSYYITNNDKDNLYVIDPDKMGSNLFHYYTGGVSLQSNSNYYFPEYAPIQIPEPYNSWKKEWFTKIESGKTIERIITVKGYHQIPKGTYNCSMRFSGPKNIEADDRNLPDGRLWLGDLEAKSVITVD